MNIMDFRRSESLDRLDNIDRQIIDIDFTHFKSLSEEELWNV